MQKSHFFKEKENKHFVAICNNICTSLVFCDYKMTQNKFQLDFRLFQLLFEPFSPLGLLFR